MSDSEQALELEGALALVKSLKMQNQSLRAANEAKHAEASVDWEGGVFKMGSEESVRMSAVLGMRQMFRELRKEAELNESMDTGDVWNMLEACDDMLAGIAIIDEGERMRDLQRWLEKHGLRERPKVPCFDHDEEVSDAVKL